MTRAFLESQSSSFYGKCEVLGRKPLGIFVRVVLPFSRPAIVAGAFVVIYEVLSDYGVTAILAFTLIYAIFQTWFGMYDIDSAMRLAAWLMVIIVGLFFLERLLRKGGAIMLNNKSRPLVPMKLKVLTCSGCLFVLREWCFCSDF